MDNDIVLGKFFATYELITKQKKNIHKDDDFSNYIDKISSTGRNILRILLKNGSLNQRTIAKYSNISSQAVSEALKKLVRDSLIKKNSGVINNENLIELTELGENIAIVLDRKIKNHASIVFENMSKDEIEQFYKLLNKLNIE
ncbi:MarR family winged helix-turn-helix transcriptional regulator [Tannockella kyphosi]|uniref:MarR family winged helix-turn-helix transcriptional regulator n=1 Tax=Tannockella kyphosi TaxID=2899121 RepID=UPI0020132849|nr:winged helix-turn-helix transcriptional regulator [Tannockella kyphosi]